MCGIFGGISIKDPHSTLNLMGEVLSHRGPDDSGEYIDKNVALGHRRLSIIDLASGHQPMISTDKQQVIVYNGEIYNFKEIKGELVKKGHAFVTESDTEVILNAYREWGYDCLDRFNGMFAFALWDNTRKKLWLVRDRIGKKPLYFMKAGNIFYFASEAKALWKVPGFSGEYDLRAIDQYLTFRYVPGTRTFYKGLTKLAAGHWMVVDEEANICQLKQWWDIPRNRLGIGEGKNSSIRDYYEEFHEIFSSSVKLRLISDVPLGLFLSSGIDSSSIAFEMAKVSKPTFITIGFGEKTDELNTASLLAKELDAQYFPFIMANDAFDMLPKAVLSMDEPYGDPIILPTFLLSKNAAQKVKVVLTGDGADELLGGYIHHDFFRKMPDNLPVFIYRLTAKLLGMFSPVMLSALFNYPASLGASGKERMLKLLNVYPDLTNSYLTFSSVFNETDKNALYSDDFKDALRKDHDEIGLSMVSQFNRKDIDAFDKVLQWDFKTWFPEQTLMKLDRLSMANSIESRCPYADYRLVELLFRAPAEIFKSCSRNKNIVRKEYRKNMPFLSKRKQAFYLPLNNIFNPRVKELAREALNDNQLKETGWFKRGYVENLLARRAQPSLLADKQLMNLVILLFWLKHQKTQTA